MVYYSIFIYTILILLVVLVIIKYRQYQYIEHFNDTDIVYAKCPTGYILSGGSCVPDGSAQEHQCNKNDKKLPNGICEKVDLVKCPNGFITKTTNCYNPITNQQLPFTSANCNDGATQKGPFCYTDYTGICMPYFKNTKIGDKPCVQEVDIISPSCDEGYSLRDGRCYKQTT